MTYKPLFDEARAVGDTLLLQFNWWAIIAYIYVGSRTMHVAISEGLPFYKVQIT